jgi:hypothetical protein
MIYKEIDSVVFPKKYAVCTLVTDMTEYQEMCNSFHEKGFNDLNTEFFYIDNTKTNKYEAFAGLNKLLTMAQSEFVILCHQDIILHDDEQKLSECINVVSQKDPDWAVLGNAGGRDFMRSFVYYINQDKKTDITPNIDFPVRVECLDENFILVKKMANLGFSHDLQGYHWYGADLSIQADRLGFSTYVIPFLLWHKSAGNPDKSFDILKEQFIRKNAHTMRPRYIRAMFEQVFISHSSFYNTICNLKLGRWFTKKYWQIFRSKN